MRSKSISQKRTRKGYAYPYVRNDDDDDDDDEENEDDLYEIIEVDPSSQDIDFVQKEIVEKDPSSQDDVEKDVVGSKLTKDVNVIDVEATVTTPIPKIAKKGENRINSKREKKKQTWEDRAASYERIPPKGVMAWGPDGEMDVDARTYAATCALEEIENAKTVFSKKEEAVNEAEQNLIELKRELSVLKKELLEEDNRRRSSILRDEIRILNFDIDEGSRRLRRAKSEALLAIDKLEETELRHWTLLRQYEADQQLEVLGNSTKCNEEQEDKI